MYTHNFTFINSRDERYFVTWFIKQGLVFDKQMIIWTFTMHMMNIFQYFDATYFKMRGISDIIRFAFLKLRLPVTILCKERYKKRQDKGEK